MISRISLAFLATSALFASSCAAEAPQNEAKQVSAPAPVETVAETTAFSAPDAAWRDVDQADLMYIDSNHGQIIVELYPEISPKHVAQIKALVGKKFYDYITFHRVIEGFMNQTGDPKGDGTGDSDMPNIEAEFSFRRDPGMGVTLVGTRPLQQGNPGRGEVGVGFYKGLPVATLPSAQAIATKDGKVHAFGLHCKGVTSMARSSDPNSANSQFFLMRGTATHLDAAYSIWGNTVWGHENLTKIKVGAKGETPGFVPDKMDKVRMGTDLAVEQQRAVQVIDTSSPAFKNYLKTFKKDDGTYPDICDIPVPTRLKP